jgi:hypothetical protein
MAHRLTPLTPPLFFHFTLPVKVEKLGLSQDERNMGVSSRL